MKAYLLLPLLSLSVPFSAFAEAPAGAPASLPPTAAQCAECEKRAQPAPLQVDTVRRDGGIALTVLGSAGIAAGIAQFVAGEVLTYTRCDPACESRDSRALWIFGGPTIGLGVSMVSFGVVLLATDAWKDDAPKAAAGEPFAIDERPRAVAPRYWLGEF